MINRAQGMQIVQTAKASGEWTYSQGQPGEPAVNYAGRVGDCTDYCRNAVQATLGEIWAGGEKANTAAFRAGLAAGFTEVESTAAQPGDVVVQGGHAGIFTGVNSKGEIRALADNGSPTSSVTGYRDSRTRVTTFGPGRFGQGPVRFFRPLVQEDP
ncbi:MAG: CHAP domain-containing protein [Gammaproteobacteria bacterium]